MKFLLKTLLVSYVLKKVVHSFSNKKEKLPA